MPQLKFRGIQAEKLCTISSALTDELQKLLECPREYITIESLHSTFIRDGEITTGYPFVEVAWFDRGQELQDKAAQIITRYVHELGCKDVDVIFFRLERESYYENGIHF